MSALQIFPPAAMTGNTTTFAASATVPEYAAGQYVASSSESVISGTEAFQAFNKNLRSGNWRTNGDDYARVTGNYVGIRSLGGISGAWIKLKMPVKISLTELRISQVSSRNAAFDDVDLMTPRDFRILVSNDDVNWLTLCTFTSIDGTYWGDGSWTTFNLEAGTAVQPLRPGQQSGAASIVLDSDIAESAFSHYALVFTRSNNTSQFGEYILFVGDVEFYGAADVPVPTTLGSLRNHTHKISEFTGSILADRFSNVPLAKISGAVHVDRIPTGLSVANLTGNTLWNRAANWPTIPVSRFNTGTILKYSLQATRTRQLHLDVGTYTMAAQWGVGGAGASGTTSGDNLRWSSWETQWGGWWRLNVLGASFHSGYTGGITGTWRNMGNARTDESDWQYTLWLRIV